MKLLFVARKDDVQAETALDVLTGLGQETKLLGLAEVSPPDSIALFTPLKPITQGARGRLLRCSAIKLLDPAVAPAWVTTPFRVAVLRTDRPSRGDRIEPGRRLCHALEQLVYSYTEWLSGERSGLVPWGSYERDPSISPSSLCMTKAREWAAAKAVQDLRRTWIISKDSQKDIETIPVGQWQVNFCRREFRFITSAVGEAIRLLEMWKGHFRSEETWVRTALGVPSLFVRLDCIVRDGRLVVYEVEERPAGLGISSFVNPEFAANLKREAEKWPLFSVKISPLRRATDDYLWQEALTWPRDPETGLVLVRAEPEERDFHSLEPFSVSSLKAKGDKSYGESMRLWCRVTVSDELPWERCFVLKPLQGSKLKDLEIWDPKKRPGSSPKGRVLETLAKNRTMFCQEFFDPMETGIKKFPWMIFRIFFSYDPFTQSWKCLGGNWNARHNLRIHGASDAIFGPAVVE